MALTNELISEIKELKIDRNKLSQSSIQGIAEVIAEKITGIGNKDAMLSDSKRRKRGKVADKITDYVNGTANLTTIKKLK